MTDELHDLDLAAWEAPPPPKGLADAVIARVLATDDAIAVALRARRRRRVITAAACIGTIAASAGLWLGLHASAPAPADDVFAATAPREVAFGSTSVDLDAGSVLLMHRDGHQLHAVQSGTATWHVAQTDTLVIEAGSASIEATGASLRVEATMNTSAARVATGVALTAAAVSLVGITVYEGRVARTEHGRTVILEPAAPALVGGGALAPAPIPTVPAHGLVPHHGDLAIAAGESAVIFSTRDRLAVEIQHECHAPPNAQAAPFRVELVLDRRPGEHLDQPLPVIADAGASDASAAWYTLLAGTYTYTATCGTVVGTGTIEVRQDRCRSPSCQDPNQLVVLGEPGIGAVFGGGDVHVAGAAVAGATLSVDGALAPVGAHGAFAFDVHAVAGQAIVVRADEPTRGTQFYVQFSERATGPATLVQPADSGPKPGSCDDLIRVAMSAMSDNDYGTALRRFEAAYACKPDTHTLQLAFMAACNARNLQHARHWWKRLSSDEQNRNVVMCIRRGISRDDLDAR